MKEDLILQTSQFRLYCDSDENIKKVKSTYKSSDFTKEGELLLELIAKNIRYSEVVPEVNSIKVNISKNELEENFEDIESVKQSVFSIMEKCIHLKHNDGEILTSLAMEINYDANRGLSLEISPFVLNIYKAIADAG